MGVGGEFPQLPIVVPGTMTALLVLPPFNCKIASDRPGFTLVDAPVQRSGGCPNISNYPSSKMKPTLVSTNDPLLVHGHLIFEEICLNLIFEEICLKSVAYRTLSN